MRAYWSGFARPLLLVLLLFVQCSEGDGKYYVIPDDGYCPLDVPDTNCFSLSEYGSVDPPIPLAQSDSVFVFRNGTHHLPENRSLLIHNATNLVWSGEGELKPGFHDTVTQSTVLIQCRTPNSSIAFVYGRNITIEGITITGCGMLINYSYPQEAAMRHANRSDLLAYNVTLIIFEVYSMQVMNFSIQNGSGYGMLVVNGFDMKVERSSFAQSNLQVFQNNFRCENCHGANVAFFFFPPFSNCPPGLVSYTLELQSTNVSLGVDALTPSSKLSSGGGLTIYLDQGATYVILVKLDMVTSYANTALVGANIALVVTNLVTYYQFSMTNSVSSYANSVYKLSSLENGVAAYSHGCGLFVFRGVSVPMHTPNCTTNTPFSTSNTPINIENCSFTANMGGYGTGAYLELFNMLSSDEIIYVNLTGTTFTGNMGDSCAALYIQSVNSGLGMPAVVVLEEVTVQDSLPFLSSPVSQSSLCGDSIYSLIMTNCTVSNNSGTGLQVFDSRIMFTGKNLFFNNVGNNGGGLAMYGSTFFVLQYPAFVNFSNNCALIFGGGIFVDEKSFLSQYCFFQIGSFGSHSQNSSEGGILFIGNSAQLAGSVLYGGRISECQLLPASPLDRVNSDVAFDAIFNFSSQTGESIISSPPIRVCFCGGGMPACEMHSMSMQARAGQDISLSIALIGQRNGTTPGIIFVEEYAGETKVNSRTFNQNAGCQPLSYMIQSPPGSTSTILYLSVLQQSTLNDDNLSMSKVYTLVNIIVEPCPQGFEYTSSADSSCSCSTTLLEATNGSISCNGTSLEVTTYGGVWVGYDESYDCVLAYIKCPFDYCLHRELTFLLNDPDVQCNYNRSGLLCGGCAANFSAVLGTNRCKVCTDDYLLMVIPFALAGIALVVLLIALNLTVSVGTINGLIFYANIVLVSRFIFFAEGPITFLTTFIAWINLDLGIEVCFYDGMDGYDKMWLQLVFPVYIWIIMGALAILARYSTKFANFLGTNVVPVLSTLLLLSCLKLYRTVIQMLAIPGNGKIGCNESSGTVVWYVDPNIQYFDPNHISMLVVALLVLVVVILPYTFILLLSPLLEHLSQRYTCCQFWGRLKYFFDAYNAPYKDTYRFWTGFLLLARLVMMMVLSFFDSTVVLATIVFSVALILTLLVSFGGVYHSRYLDMLEASFFLNLMFMSAFVINGHTRTGTYIGVSVAFVIFSGIVLFHVYLCAKQIIQYGKPTKVYEVLRQQRSILEDPMLDIEGTINNISKKARRTKTTTVNIRDGSCSIEVIRRRESLLRENTEATEDHYKIHGLD